MAIPHFPYLTDRYIGFLFFLAIMNNAAMNIHAHIFVWTHVFHFLGYILWVELLGHIFEELQNFFKVVTHFTFPVSIPLYFN